MSLTCPECGDPVPDNTSGCPHCGYVLTETDKADAGPGPGEAGYIAPLPPGVREAEDHEICKDRDHTLPNGQVVEFRTSSSGSNEHFDYSYSIKYAGSTLAIHVADHDVSQAETISFNGKEIYYTHGGPGTSEERSDPSPAAVKWADKMLKAARRPKGEVSFREFIIETFNGPGYTCQSIYDLTDAQKSAQKDEQTAKGCIKWGCLSVLGLLAVCCISGIVSDYLDDAKVSAAHELYESGKQAEGIAEYEKLWDSTPAIKEDAKAVSRLADHAGEKGNEGAVRNEHPVQRACQPLPGAERHGLGPSE